MEIEPTLAATSTRLLNTHGGRMGSTAVRSMRANKVSRTAAPTNRPML